jgi:hypothetical protein
MLVAPCAGSIAAGLAGSFCLVKLFSGLAAEGGMTLSSPKIAASVVALVAAELVDRFCSLKPCAFTSEADITLSRSGGMPCAGSIAPEVTELFCSANFFATWRRVITK